MRATGSSQAMRNPTTMNREMDRDFLGEMTRLRVSTWASRHLLRLGWVLALIGRIATSDSRHERVCLARGPNQYSLEIPHPGAQSFACYAIMQGSAHTLGGRAGYVAVLGRCTREPHGWRTRMATVCRRSSSGSWVCLGSRPRPGRNGRAGMGGLVQPPQAALRCAATFHLPSTDSSTTVEQRPRQRRGTPDSPLNPGWFSRRDPRCPGAGA